MVQVVGRAMGSGNTSRGRQPVLFRLDDPLTSRFGSGFFAALPPTPGVYFFSDKDGRLLYIGQSNNLRARIGSYRFVAPGRHPRRSLRLVARIREIRWEICPTPAEAIERERELLLERRPPFNRAGVWVGSPWWLTHELDPGVLRLQLTRESDGVGPLPPSFRYAFGALARCVFRALRPEIPFQLYPHGLARSIVPLGISLPVGKPHEAWQLVASCVAGEVAPLLALLEALPPPDSASLAEFWQEEQDRISPLGRTKLAG